MERHFRPAISLPVPGQKHLQFGGNSLYLITFNKVTDLNVIIVFKAHTAFIAFFNFLDVFFETFELAEIAVMDNDIVTQQADFCTAFDQPFGNHTAGNFAHPGNIKDIADFGITENLLFEFGRQHAFQTFLHVIGHIVDNRIITNINTVATGHIPRLRNGTNVKPDSKAFEAFASVMSDSEIGPTAECRI